MAGIGLTALARQQSTQTAQVGIELARSVANAVDAELRTSVSVLETLATTPALDVDGMAGFQDRALRVVASRSAWAAIALADPAGHALFDTRSEPGGRLPAGDPQSFDRVLRTRAPAIGGLARQGQGEWLFAVRVPVIRNRGVRYVLTAIIKPDAIRDVLTRQQLPDDWVISIVDASGLRVARSRAHEENLGGRLSPSAQRVVANGSREGTGLSYTLEGERIFTPYSPVASSGWMAVLGIPTAVIDAAAYRSLAAYGGGIVLSILLGTFGALWIARGITRPIGHLRRSAEAIGHGEVPPPPATSIQEIREVGLALARASRELARGEAEREELLVKERHARETAEAADRAKDEFMAVLSHELRTPLNAVYGWARMLQTGELRDEAVAARAKDAIVRNADVQVRLIDDLLDLSRITSGKMRLSVSRVPVRQVVEDALDAVRPAAAAKQIDLRLIVDDDPGSVNGDPARLQQIVWNLLMNAVKFTPPGGQVQLHAECVDAYVRIVIADTGQGIPPEVLPHVFERFRQADSSSTRSHGGLGLGLALVKHLVELHGGTVQAQSAGPGLGATFTVNLPIASAAPAERPAKQQETAPGAVASPNLVRLTGVRVLVVDDDRESVALADAILRSAGASVRTCFSAEEAMQAIVGSRPDVLLSDIEMPGEDGYTLIRKVRALARELGGETPAVALTAYGRSQDRLRCLAAGFTMHIPKPVDPGELTSIIASLTAASQPASS